MKLPNSLLIVDDDPELLKLLGNFAEQAGIKKILCVKSSKELDDKIDQDYSVSIVDLFLLNECGADIIVNLKKKFKNMSIFAMTGFADRNDIIKKAHKAGALSCLLKPVSYNYFLNMMYLAESIRIKNITFRQNHTFPKRFFKKIGHFFRHFLGHLH